MFMFLWQVCMYTGAHPWWHVFNTIICGGISCNHTHSIHRIHCPTSWWSHIKGDSCQDLSGDETIPRFITYPHSFGMTPISQMQVIDYHRWICLAGGSWFLINEALSCSAYTLKNTLYTLKNLLFWGFPEIGVPKKCFFCFFFAFDFSAVWQR
jgi:hypothetical protein